MENKKAKKLLFWRPRPEEIREKNRDNFWLYAAHGVRQKEWLTFNEVYNDVNFGGGSPHHRIMTSTDIAEALIRLAEMGLVSIKQED